MDWNNYYYDFCKQAKECGKNDEYCKQWLEYAHNLYEHNLPIIYNQEHFSMLVGYKLEYLYAVSNSPNNFYRHYQIPKKSGGTRPIDEPLPSLKEIQRWILDNILVHMKISVYAKAYVKDKSIRDNARFHKKQKKVLSLDIKDFFLSVSSKKVFELFTNAGYSSDVVVMLTNICCLNGSLPQGAPTSPMLSNIILYGFDCQIGKYTGERKIRYTRYADDMTFSGDFSTGQIISLVKKNLYQIGLRLNGDKTRTRCPNQRQEVTGIVVNEKMQLPKNIRKKIRQEMFYIKKFGLDSHLQYLEIQKENYIAHLRGVIHHGLFINPRDNELKSYLQFLNDMYGA